MVSESLATMKQDIRDLKIMKQCTEDQRIDIPLFSIKQQLDEFDEKLEDKEFSRATVFS